MLHIQIIQVGKTKEKFFIEAENEFIKRLSAYAKLQIDTVEEDKILNRAWKDSYKIVLEIKGKEFSSEDFAKLLGKIMEKGKVTFIIGGPFGLSKPVIEKADLKFSMSKMTFTHQMVRIILLEQIYRGFTILKGKKYHY